MTSESTSLQPEEALTKGEPQTVGTRHSGACSWLRPWGQGLPSPTPLLLFPLTPLKAPSSNSGLRQAPPKAGATLAWGHPRSVLMAASLSSPVSAGSDLWPHYHPGL